MDTGNNPDGTSIVASDRHGAMIGRYFGVYHVKARIGAGGMGEVYRARDTRLGRDVAVKILPSQFVADPERRSRFEREARTLASLNHPHIAAIFGVEETVPGEHQSGIALILELVEGDTLADRLRRGPTTPACSLDRSATSTRGVSKKYPAGAPDHSFRRTATGSGFFP